MTLHLHRAARTDQLADRLGRAAGVAAGRPVRDRGGRGAGEGRRALALPAAVPPARCRGGAGRRGLRRRRLPQSRGRCSRSCRAGPTPIPGRPTRWPGRCCASSTPPSASRGQATLSRHLGHDLAGDAGEVRRGRRFATARRLAGLFASYAEQRPALIADWAAGRDTDGAGRPDPRRPGLAAGALAAARRPGRGARSGAPAGEASTGCAPIPSSVDLPSRVNLFGHTRLATGDLVLLEALAADRDVHLWLPHPSSALWSRLTDLAAMVPRVGGPLPPPGRASAARDSGSRHPRAAANARRGRLRRRAGRRRAGPAADSLLGWLQADLRANAPGRPDARTLRPDRPVRPAARVPRPRPTGRRAARGGARPARRRPDPRASRRAGDVPRHRELCAAAVGCVRPRRRGRSRGPPRPSAAGEPRRPGPRPDQPAAGRRRPAARPRRRAARVSAPSSTSRTPSRSAGASVSATTTSTCSRPGSSRPG